MSTEKVKVEHAADTGHYLGFKIQEASDEGKCLFCQETRPLLYFSPHKFYADWNAIDKLDPDDPVRLEREKKEAHLNKYGPHRDHFTNFIHGVPMNKCEVCFFKKPLYVPDRNMKLSLGAHTTSAIMELMESDRDDQRDRITRNHPVPDRVIVTPSSIKMGNMRPTIFARPSSSSIEPPKVEVLEDDVFPYIHIDKSNVLRYIDACLWRARSVVYSPFERLYSQVYFMLCPRKEHYPQIEYPRAKGPPKEEPVREPKRRQSAAQMISRRASEGVRFAMQKVGRQKSSAMEDSKLEDAKMEDSKEADEGNDDVEFRGLVEHILRFDKRLVEKIFMMLLPWTLWPISVNLHDDYKDRTFMTFDQFKTGQDGFRNRFVADVWAAIREEKIFSMVDTLYRVDKTKSFPHFNLDPMGFCWQCEKWVALTDYQDSGKRIIFENLPEGVTLKDLLREAGPEGPDKQYISWKRILDGPACLRDFENNECAVCSMKDFSKT